MAPGPIVDGPAAAIDRTQEYGDSPDAGIYRASITAVISVHPDYEPI